jgi:hypothetical protein
MLSENDKKLCIEFLEEIEKDKQGKIRNGYKPKTEYYEYGEDFIEEKDQLDILTILELKIFSTKPDTYIRLLSAKLNKQIKTPKNKTYFDDNYSYEDLTFFRNIIFKLIEDLEKYFMIYEEKYHNEVEQLKKRFANQVMINRKLENFYD